MEFGAWDGKHFSNTWNLWANLGWEAILIEGDRDKFEALRKAVSGNSKVVPINAYVGFEGESSLDQILEQHGIASEVDVLSIDIDGDDYHVFEAVRKYLPRIALVEFNPTCPPGVEIVQSKGASFGCSAWSLLRLAESKDYRLVACTDTNMILVRSCEFAALSIDPVDLGDIYPKQYLSYVLSDYSGKTYISRMPVYQEGTGKGVLRSILGRSAPSAFPGNSPRSIRISTIN